MAYELLLIKKEKRVPGFEVNTLTVMANESYEEFATGLQNEYEEEGIEFGVFNDDILVHLSLMLIQKQVTKPFRSSKIERACSIFKEQITI